MKYFAYNVTGSDNTFTICAENELAAYKAIEQLDLKGQITYNFRQIDWLAFTNLNKLGK